MENDFVIKWQAIEFEYKKKGPDWFWVLWIISVGIIVVLVIYNNILFAILIFISAFTLSLQATRRPQLINFEINSSGILINNKKYIYDYLDSYWIKEKNDDEPPQIILKSKKTFMLYIIISLDNVDVQKVDGFLTDYLTKEEHHEPIPYKIAKFF